MMGLSKAIVLLGGLLLSSGIHAETYYKWTDEQGRVHYGDHIPPEYADGTSERFEKHGLIIERHLSAEEIRRKKELAEREARALRVKEEARRRDKALLSTYLSEREIDLARDRALQSVDFEIHTAEVRLRTAQDRQGRLDAEAERYARTGKEVPAELNQERLEATDEVANFQQQVRDSRREKAEIRDRYDADKQRFLELIGKR
jgi:Domain of unknown function (DUF4124)